jgi:hypothetical protein
MLGAEFMLGENSAKILECLEHFILAPDLTKVESRGMASRDLRR